MGRTGARAGRVSRTPRAAMRRFISRSQRPAHRKGGRLVPVRDVDDLASAASESNPFPDSTPGFSTISVTLEPAMDGRIRLLPPLEGRSKEDVTPAGDGAPAALYLLVPQSRRRSPLRSLQ